MNKTLVLVLATAGTLLGTGAAQAADVQWSVGINVPGIVLAGGPVLRLPLPLPIPVPTVVAAPLYAPVPVAAQMPGLYAPEPVYHPRPAEWRHHRHDRPVVVVQPYAPRWERGWQPVMAPRYVPRPRDDRRDHHDHDRD